MKELEIVPYRSIGNIEFGQPRAAVRKVLGKNFTSFRKDVGERLTDSYDGRGLHLYFDADDCLEFVEAFSPAKIQIRGIPLLGRTVEEVFSDLKKKRLVKGALERERLASGKPDPCMMLDEIGVAFTIEESVIEGVGVYKQGYYDD